MNPAVTKLFEAVENPVLTASAIAALNLHEPLSSENVPADLVEPLFILTVAAREMGGRAIVDRPDKLRERVSGEDADVNIHHKLTHDLLDGAGFNTEPPRFSEAARMNCEPGEVRLEFLPEGARFQSCGRLGQLIYKTPSRAVIEITGEPKQKTFKNHQAGGAEGADVTITTSGRTRTGCALDAPVKPIFATVNHEDKVWALNAWKEIAGVYEETPEEAPQQKRKRTRA